MEPYLLPAAELGPENPLPLFRAEQEDSTVRVDESVPAQDRRYLGWRAGHRVLPYRMQDGYRRDRRLHSFPAAVLENEHLRATVLPGRGGRLVSLVHRPSGRELLARNPVFQPANLALRDAWCSGGIEWNAGQPGHHYLTCSPVFAARIRGTQGEPALRLYEWERVKGFTWQVDLHLPPGSPFLFARVRLVNPHPHQLAMYWWSNIAAPEQPGSRVLCPADTALTSSPGGYTVIALPHWQGRDFTYPTHLPYAHDFFFRVPPGSRPWIACLDQEGKGICQASTGRLRGRKLFCWGTGTGGSRWQEFLAAPGHAYLEIQAGLARTQLECLPMPARARWAWTEAFGLLEADPAAVHQPDWWAARREAQARLEAALPPEALPRFHRAAARIATRPPEELLALGSGWGALERRRADTLPPELPFPASTLGPDQEPWLRLLAKGALPERAAEADPGQLMVQPEWRELLEVALAAGQGAHWWARLQLGVMRMEAGDREGAREAWEHSLADRPTGWALRNLAVLELRQGRPQQATRLLAAAWEAGPRVPALAVEYAEALLREGRYQDLRSFTATLPAPVRENERITLLSAWAAVHTGHLEEVGPIFAHEFACTREGEVTLTELWFAWHERRLAQAEGASLDEALKARVRRECPPPREIDFRMHA